MNLTEERKQSKTNFLIILCFSQDKIKMMKSIPKPIGNAKTNNNTTNFVFVHKHKIKKRCMSYEKETLKNKRIPIVLLFVLICFTFFLFI